MIEIARCPACDGTERAVVYPATPSLSNAAALRDPYAAHYQINRCAGCGLLRSSPIFEPDSVGRLYRDASEANTSDPEVDNVRRTMAGYYRLMRGHLPGRQRVLDIGCDRGLLLQAARADGFRDVCGIEPNPLARAEAEAVLKVPIADGFYEQAEYPPSHFDAITLIHVLDHVIDPAMVLRRARDHVRPAGIVLAIVHNADSWLARILGERFPAFNLYHHYFFTMTTLRRLFEGVGYEALHVGPTKNCYSLSFLVGKVPGVPAAATRWTSRALAACRLGALPITVGLGNIGIVARKPA